MFGRLWVELAGKVLIQTTIPDNRIFHLAKNNDFDTFAEEELLIREQFSFPPSIHLVKYTFSGKNEEKVEKAACAFNRSLKKYLSSTTYLTPVMPSGRPKLRDRYRYQFLAKSLSVYHLNEAADKVEEELFLSSTVKMTIDVDPLSTFF